MSLTISQNGSELYKDIWTDGRKRFIKSQGDALLDQSVYEGNLRIILDKFIFDAPFAPSAIAFGPRIPNDCKLIDVILITDEKTDFRDYSLDLVLTDGNKDTDGIVETLIPDIEGDDILGQFYSIYPNYIDAHMGDFISIHNTSQTITVDPPATFLLRTIFTASI